MHRGTLAGTSRLHRFTSVLVLVGGGATPAVWSAPPAFQQAVLDDQPVLYYKFDQTTGDEMNHGSLGATHNAVYNGTVLRGAATPFGDSAVSFNGADDYLESIGAAPMSLLGNPTFTAEAVFLVPAIGGAATNYGPFLHWGPSNVSPNGKSVYFSFSNANPTELYAGFYNGGLQSPSGSLALGQWHHVVWIRNGTGNPAANAGSTVFIDGVNVTAALANDPDLCCNTSVPAVEATAFRVNRARDSVRFFVGSIDELALYDRALTVEEVAAHFAELPFDTGLDVDANGAVSALTDGLLMVRYFFGLRGTALTSGVVAGNCTRCTAAEIEAYIESSK